MSTLIGTSGYSYPEWKEVFYPTEIRALNYLEYYSRYFPFVELNFSYYTQPKFEALKKLQKSVPSPFVFSIKLHKSITHELWLNAEQFDPKALQTACDTLVQASTALGKPYFVAQFPWSFRYQNNNRKFLDQLHSTFTKSMQTCFPDSTGTNAAPLLCLEFRNPEWLNQRVLKEIRQRTLIPILYDAPDAPGLQGSLLQHPWLEAVEDSVVYIRMHGRNKDAWWTGDSRSRYDYEYSEKELQEIAELLTKHSDKPNLLFIAFNNHAAGKAVRNAKTLNQLLEPGK